MKTKTVVLSPGASLGDITGPIPGGSAVRVQVDPHGDAAWSAGTPAQFRLDLGWLGQDGIVWEESVSGSSVLTAAPDTIDLYTTAVAQFVRLRYVIAPSGAPVHDLDVSVHIADGTGYHAIV